MKDNIINILKKMLNNLKKNKIILFFEKKDIIHKVFFLECIFLILVVIFSVLKLENLSLIMLVISSVLLIKFTRDLIGNYSNIPFFFVCFHILYGLSGVISVVWGSGLSATYGKVFEPCSYMIAYSLCTLCLLIGMFFSNKKYENNNLKVLNVQKEQMNLKNYFIFVALCGFLLTLVLELINFIRVGGINTLLLGKALYQAAVDQLKFTFPTQLICQVSLSSLGIYIILCRHKKEKCSKKAIIVCCLTTMPYLLLLLFLGRRGPLLAYLLIFVLIIGQIKPLKKISMKFIVILAIVYFSIASLYGIRNHINLIFTDFNQFVDNVFDKRNVMQSLNPGYNEFGCTFGNFNKLYISNNYDLLYGKSYINGLVHFIPEYLYPGEKPQMITYQFRDEYFSFKAEISSIASTAFSSILETFWNFWYFGAIIYVLYGYFIILLNNTMKNKNFFTLLLCVAISPFVYGFHRSEFGHVIMEFILISFCILFIYFFYINIYNKQNNFSKICHKISEI